MSAETIIASTVASNVASTVASTTVTAPPSRKRKSDASTTSTPSGIRRFRASRACQYCRTRKVRCDVLLRTDSGCTNCRLDGRECVLLASRRGRPECWGCEQAVHTTVVPAGVVPAQSVSSTATVQVQPANSVQPAKEAPSPPPPDAPPDVPVCVTFHGDEELKSTTTPDRYVHAPSLDALSLSPASSTANHCGSGGPSHGPGSGCSPGSTAAAALPAFLAPFRNRIPPEDLEFLALKGALTIPPPDLRLAILRGYVFSVYPFMPMLDLGGFVEAVEEEDQGGGTGTVSLLLFQAVMFAGLSSLETPVLHRLGFATAKQARAVFFTRVKLLYEFDIEPDGAAVFQALLLMSSWFSTWSEWRDTSYWTAQAALVAQNLGLHRQPTAACGPPRVQALRRRMWWSLLIRDRMLALGTRRPMRVRDDDYDVGMLAMSDFSFDPRLSRVGLDVDQQRATARLCIDLARLCVVAGHVLATQYTVLSTQPAVAHTTMVVPRRSGPRPQALQRLDGEIDEWVRQRAVPGPGVGQWTDIGSVSVTPGLGTQGTLGPPSCADVHTAMLSMTHLTLVNVLHRTQALQPVVQGNSSNDMRMASRRKVKDAACRVTTITQALLRRGLVRFLGLNGITALLAACLSHMVDIRTGNDDVRDASLFRFDQSMQVLQAMRGMYATADAAVAFLAGVVRKVRLRAPWPGGWVGEALEAGAGAAGAPSGMTAGAPATDWNYTIEPEPLPLQHHQQQQPPPPTQPPPPYDDVLRLPLEPLNNDHVVFPHVVPDEQPMDFEPILYNYEFFMDNFEFGEEA